MTIIATQALTKTYGGGVTALADLTVDVERGRHRAGRRERRRQVHPDQDPARPARADQRRGAGASASTRPPRPTRSGPGSATCRSTTACRRTSSAAEFVTHLGRMSGLPQDRRPRARLRGAAPRRPLRGALPADRRLLHRHEAAGQAGPGARARPRPAAARRADQRPRPGRPRRHARADPPDRHRVRHLRGGLLAPARRGRADLRLAHRDRRRPAAARRPDLGDDHGHRRARRRGQRGYARSWPPRLTDARAAGHARDGRLLLVPLDDDATTT